MKQIFLSSTVKSSRPQLTPECVIRLREGRCILFSASAFCILMGSRSYLGQSSADNWENTLQVLHPPASLSNQFFTRNQWRRLRTDSFTWRQIMDRKRGTGSMISSCFWWKLLMVTNRVFHLQKWPISVSSLFFSADQSCEMYFLTGRENSLNITLCRLNCFGQ